MKTSFELLSVPKLYNVQISLVYQYPIFLEPFFDNYVDYCDSSQ